ncbi:MAG: segregation and condensation protein A [Maricaulaceae bacterium]
MSAFEPSDLDLSEDRPALHLALGAYEGPLHVLLDLAQREKVDLKHISILTLAEQYVAFIREAQALDIDLAADYLVMAAWLAFLKSKLLAPKPDRAEADDEPEAEELARRLAFQLVRLDAMRQAGERLMAGRLLDRDVFARGRAEGVRTLTTPAYDADLHSLLKAYGEARRPAARAEIAVEPPNAYALEAARVRLSRMLGRIPGWRALEGFVPEPEHFRGEPPDPASRLASTFAASLELAREGKLSLKQMAPFGPIFVRAGGAEDASAEEP